MRVGLSMRVNAVKGVHLFDCEVKELGCCTDVVALKKESLLKLQKDDSGYKYTDLFSKVLVECYDSEREETTDGRWILSTNTDVLRRLFAPDLGCGTTRKVSERVYKDVVLSLEHQLQTKTLLECATDEKFDWGYYQELCSVYRELKNAKIDFSNEILVIGCG